MLDTGIPENISFDAPMPTLQAKSCLLEWKLYWSPGGPTALRRPANHERLDRHSRYRSRVQHFSFPTFRGFCCRSLAEDHTRLKTCTHRMSIFLLPIVAWLYVVTVSIARTTAFVIPLQHMNHTISHSRYRAVIFIQRMHSPRWQ